MASSNNTTARATKCHAMKATSNGAFQGDNPLAFALPLAILQMCLVLCLTRVLAFLLKPIRQPRVIAEIVNIEDQYRNDSRCPILRLLVLVITTACFGKIVGTVCVSLLCRVPFQEALALGFLMNTKGLVELIVLNIGEDRKVLNYQTFAIMVLMAIVTTFMTTPLVMAVYKPAKQVSRPDFKYRTIQRKDLIT